MGGSKTNAFAAHLLLILLLFLAEFAVWQLAWCTTRTVWLEKICHLVMAWGDDHLLHLLKNLEQSVGSKWLPFSREIYIIPVHRPPSYYWWAIDDMDIRPPGPVWKGHPTPQKVPHAWKHHTAPVPNTYENSCDRPKIRVTFLKIRVSQLRKLIITLPVSIVSRPNVHTIHAFCGFVLISSCLSSSNLALWPATRACLWGRQWITPLLDNALMSHRQLVPQLLRYPI